MEVAADFARSQPAIAGMAGAFGSEPFQERVREGLFFLGATVMDQVGRFEADGHATVADIVAPDLGRPVPSATIVELSAPGGGVVHVPAGAELTVRGNDRCRFRVAQAVDVASATIQECRVDTEQRLSVRFSLVSDGSRPLTRSVGRSLRIFIAEPRESALLLLHHVLSHTTRVEVRRGTETFVIRGIQAFGLDEPLTPTLEGVSNAASLAREYFLLPEKFLLFDLGGVVEPLRPEDTTVTVILRFDAPLPRQVRVSPLAFRLNCTPAVNLFATTAEPRVCSPAAASFPIRVAGLRAEESSVYDVLNVCATDVDRPDTTTVIPPARRFGAVPVDERFPYFFVTKISHDPVPGTTLTLTSAPSRPPVVHPHVISVGLLVTNAELGARVKPGELCRPGAWMPEGVVGQNIVPTSRYVPPLGPTGFMLRTITRGQVPRQDPLHVLQALLYSIVPTQAFDDQSTRAFLGRVDAIEAFDIQPVPDRTRMRRGYAASLTLDESAFMGMGDVALFLRVLHRLLDSRVSVNAFFTCRVLCSKSGERLSWPPAGKA